MKGSEQVTGSRMVLSSVAGESSDLRQMAPP